jgi:hypothetical protein
MLGCAATGCGRPAQPEPPAVAHPLQSAWACVARVGMSASISGRGLELVVADRPVGAIYAFASAAEAMRFLPVGDSWRVGQFVAQFYADSTGADRAAIVDCMTP